MDSRSEPGGVFGTGFGRLRSAQTKIGDFAVAAAVLAVVAMMIAPLRPALLDLLIGINLAASVLILCLSLFIKRPLTFTAFPTFLLIATLYRLALNVSSTRLILLQADAGRIIAGFGSVLVGGDILVGAVIFGILAMVLFLVITKGTERVAEVAARFTLDGLPGAQLAIDADLRSGALSTAEARKKREDLGRQSAYYGALDGAMKFVRGDAVAAMAIIGVNVVGGLAVGLLRHDMGLWEAVEVYGRLAVGDGLVSMVPALLVSTAAGLLVTRVGQGGDEQRLGAQLIRQMGSEPRALLATCALMLILAAVPGLPAWPFLILAGGLGAGAFKVWRAARKRVLERGEPEDESDAYSASEASAVVELGAALFAEVAGQAMERGGMRHLAREIARDLRLRFGLPIGSVPILEDPEKLKESELRVRVRGVVCGRCDVPRGGKLCLASTNELSRLGIERATPVAGIGAWISSEDADSARAAKLDVYKLLDGFVFITRAWLGSRPGRLLGMDEAGRLIEKVAAGRPVVVRETVPKLIGLPKLTRLLGELVDDGMSLEHLPEILEVLSREDCSAELEDLVDAVRARLAPVISAELLGNSESLDVLLFDSEVESVLHSSLKKTAQGRRLVLQRDISTRIASSYREAALGLEAPVLLVGARLRRAVAELLRVETPKPRVIAHGELEPHVVVDVVGRIEVF